MSGARPWRVLQRVTLRLIAPGLLAVLIYQLMTVLEVFEVPGILGLPTNIFVFSTKIYAIMHAVDGLPDYGKANALAMLYVAIAAVTMTLYLRVIRRAERYATVTGKGYRPRLQRLGRWKTAASVFVLSYMMLAVIVPFLIFLFMSLLPYLEVPSAKALGDLTLNNYRQLRGQIVTSTLWNTFILVAVTSTAVTLLSFAISFVVVRTRFLGRRVLDQLAFMPHAIPGIVMGIAFLWVFLQLGRIGVGGFGTVWDMIIAFTAGYISYGTRTMNAAMLQIHKELDEAAQVSGARRFRTMMKIFFPLVLPACAGVWIWTTLHVVRTAGQPLMLYEGSQNQVLAILIWNMWDEGYVGQVAAIGTLLIGLLMLVIVAVRYFGFRRGHFVR